MSSRNYKGNVFECYCDLDNSRKDHMNIGKCYHVFTIHFGVIYYCDILVPSESYMSTVKTLWGSRPDGYDGASCTIHAEYISMDSELVRVTRIGDRRGEDWINVKPWSERSTDFDDNTIYVSNTRLSAYYLCERKERRRRGGS